MTAMDGWSHKPADILTPQVRLKQAEQPAQVQCRAG
jgi:hypothetical protein